MRTNNYNSDSYQIIDDSIVDINMKDLFFDEITSQEYHLVGNKYIYIKSDLNLNVNNIYLYHKDNDKYYQFKIANISNSIWYEVESNNIILKSGVQIDLLSGNKKIIIGANSQYIFGGANTSYDPFYYGNYEYDETNKLMKKTVSSEYNKLIVLEIHDMELTKTNVDKSLFYRKNGSYINYTMVKKLKEKLLNYEGIANFVDYNIFDDNKELKDLEDNIF